MSDLYATIRTLRRQSGGERPPAESRPEIQGYGVPPRAFRALVIALAGGHPLYVRLEYPRQVGSLLALLRQMRGLLPPLTSEEAEEDMAIQETTFAGEEIGCVYRQTFPPLRSVRVRGEKPENVRRDLFAPGPAYRAPMTVQAHRGFLHVDGWDELAAADQQQLLEVIQEGRVLMGKTSDGEPLFYPAQFTLIASGIAPPPPASASPFDLSCSWDAETEQAHPGTAEELAGKIAAARFAVGLPGRRGHAPLLNMMPAALRLLRDAELTAAQAVRVGLVAMTIGALEGDIVPGMMVGLEAIMVAAVEEALSFFPRP